MWRPRSFVLCAENNHRLLHPGLRRLLSILLMNLFFKCFIFTSKSRPQRRWMSSTWRYRSSDFTQWKFASTSECPLDNLEDCCVNWLSVCRGRKHYWRFDVTSSTIQHHFHWSDVSLSASENSTKEWKNNRCEHSLLVCTVELTSIGFKKNTNFSLGEFAPGV